jgi:hypothetical protein
VLHVQWDYQRCLTDALRSQNAPNFDCIPGLGSLAPTTEKVVEVVRSPAAPRAGLYRQQRRTASGRSQNHHFKLVADDLDRRSEDEIVAGMPVRWGSLKRRRRLWGRRLRLRGSGKTGERGTPVVRLHEAEVFGLHFISQHLNHKAVLNP